jgi:hypothetical protein
MRGILLKAIQDYTVVAFNKKIAYNEAAYPYWFLDTNGDGTADATESVSANKFPNWSARLLRAAYNFQFALKDPGSYAHNGKYIVEILYDSIADMNAKTPVAGFANLVRNDSNHFDGNTEPYTDWDEDKIAFTGTPPVAVPQGTTTGTDHLVSNSCARCHSVDGFKFVVDNNLDPTVSQQRVNGMNCESCHEDGANFSPLGGNKPARRYVASVTFPFASYPTATSGTPATIIPSTQAQISAVTIYNGAKGTAAADDSFICMTCHRARESKLTIDASDPTGLTATFTLSSKNTHYLAAGATLYGSKAAVAYQYTGKTYVQRWDHDLGYTTPYAVNSGVPVSAAAKAQCTYCHMENGSHQFEVELNATCTGCHSNASSIATLTPAFRAEDNYDNDPTTKPQAEFAVFQARLLLSIQNYCKAAKTAGVSGAEWVGYDGSINAYWFKDTDHSGDLSAAEKVSSNAPKWDSKSYRAAFNYNFSVKEPGAWAHNPKYMLQIMYDAIQDLGGDVTGLTRP